MDKQVIINKYSKPEERLLVSKILDKIDVCKTKNKIMNTDFLDMYEKSIAEKAVAEFDLKTVFYGGFEGAERTMLIVYPEKIIQEVIESIYDKLIKIVRIILPQDLHGRYVHKNYLGAVMKLGIRREKIGDIRVSKEGADIIVSSDMAEYIANKLVELTRFSKAQIQVVNIEESSNSEQQIQELSIIVPSMRLDCVVRRNNKNVQNKGERGYTCRASFYKW